MAQLGTVGGRPVNSRLGIAKASLAQWRGKGERLLGRPALRASPTFLIGVLAFTFLPAAFGATYYVDGNCPSAGSGTNPACGSSGPKKLLADGVALLSAPGDTLMVRGVHPAHDGESAAFDGRYFDDWILISGKNGSASASIKVQPYGFTGPGTGEVVYIDGTKPPSSGWTQCSNCASGVCAGVPAAGCSETWYASDTGTAMLAVGAQKPDGSPTFAVSTASDLTNSHSSYLGSRCSVSTWKACDANLDCGSGETCTATSPEIDSYSPQNGGPILVRWGTGSMAPGGSSNPKPYVTNNNNGTGFFVSNSSYVTVRGFVSRCHVRPLTVANNYGAVSNITVSDNKLFYVNYKTSSGPDYGLASYSASPVTFSGNEVAWTTSEGIHARSKPVGPTVLTISGNWIHNVGDQRILGPAAVGTPNGMIITSDYTSTDGNWSGSVLENNFIANISYSGDKAVILEDNVNNWIIRNNVFYRMGGEGIKLDGTGVSSNGHQIYNNIFLENGVKGVNAGGGGPGIYILTTSGKTASNNVVYNNTFANNRNGGIVAECGGSCPNNVFRNNIIYDSSPKMLITYPPAGVFESNLLNAPGTGSIASINGRSSTCLSTVLTADLDGNGTANDKNRCSDPLFVSLPSRDLHLSSGSPAVDGGASAGMPSGRTSSINNSLAQFHGFPSYADNAPMSGSAWDIGAVERSASGPPTASVSVGQGGSMIGSGTYTLTLTASRSLVSLPGPLSFLESDSSTTTVSLAGTLPGTSFTGVFVVNSSVSEGPGVFSLPLNNLVDSLGQTGNLLTGGYQITIDRTAPSSPANLRFGI